MQFDKGRAKPIAWNTDIPDDSLEARLTLLSEMKAEMKAKRKEYKNNTRHLVESMKSLENIITEEVLKLGKSVTVGNIRAEYTPTVVIKLKKDKEQNDGE